MERVYIDAASSIGISETTQELLEKVPYGIAIIYNSPKFPTLQAVLDPVGEQSEVCAVASKEVLV